MLSSIFLTHFRNYTHVGVDLSAGMNCIVGNNGQGKSNLLESVYYLSLLRSFRTSNVNDLRQVGQDSFNLRGYVKESVGPETKLSVSYGTERHLQLNDAIVYRASDFINTYLCVTFIPQDLQLVQGTPLLRRRFLDIAISQVCSEYIRHLQSYTQALKSRNVMLKDCQKYPKATVTAYDTLLSEEGAYIECKRREFIKRLNEQLVDYSEKLLHDGRVISLKYLMRHGYLFKDLDKGEIELKEEFRLQLDKNYEHDIRNGSTSIGPHRSDFKFLLADISMDNFASQGECRMASLALKLSCLEVIRQYVDSESITLLIDDVIGELDNERKRHFFESAQHVGQVLLAATDIPQEIKQIDKLFRVKGGQFY